MENVARNVAERVAAAGLPVDVISSRLPARAPGRLADRVRVRRCAAIEIAHAPVIPGILGALLRVPRDTILHVHVAQPLTPELAFLVARLRGLTWLAHFHLDVGPSGPLGPLLLPAYKRWLLGPILRRAARVIVYGRDDARLLTERHAVSPGRIEIIPGGVDLPPASPATPRRDPETVLFVGRLSPQKNLPMLLDSLRVLKERGRPSRLRVVGDGEERARLAERARAAGVADRVAFVGRLEGESLAAELRAATVLALPSERESFGLVLVEAMSHALPVVATDVPGVREVVRHGETGLLARPDATAFADALERVLASPALRERLVAGGLDAAAAWDWRRIIPRYLELYARLDEERRAP
jgi:glycosyltransferase involved in cell wall biosynthesis